MRTVVTAYSEFFVVARRDRDFAEALNKADLVTPDGVSVFAACEYERLAARSKTTLGKLVSGFRVGLKVPSGRLGKPVTGVWLFKELLETAAEKHWRVFLLGGWGDVAERVSKIVQERFPGVKIAYDSGEAKLGTDKAEDERVVREINNFRPDVLFVAYGPIKQEKWMEAHRDRLKAKVAIGVGGTFDEFTGDFPQAPDVLERSGMKWLWRLIIQPSRFGRIWQAVVVFPWLVFRESLRKQIL